MDQLESEQVIDESRTIVMCFGHTGPGGRDLVNWA